MLDAVLALDRAPRWLRNAALSIAEGRGPIGAVYDRIAHRFDLADIPKTPEPTTATLRVLIGPVNEAEQGYQWARSFERFLPDVSARAMTGLDPRNYRVKTDLRVPDAVYLRSGEWQERLERYLNTLTHVFFESGLPLLGRRYASDAFIEADRLQARGIGTALIFHGSDIRSPSLHASESEWSPFVKAGLPVRLMEEKANRNRQRALESDMPIFVSTPDLLRHAPGSVWCPIVVNPADWWSENRAWPSSRRMIVAHAPSNRLLKGSDDIEPALRRLEVEGLIEYRLIHGVPYSDMPRHYAEADIVLDHFLIGNYSMVTIEALAAGCLVIGHVDEPTRQAVLNTTGLQVPVVEADIRTLEQVLRRTVADGDAINELRQRGPEFVRRVHDGRYSAEAVRGFLSNESKPTGMGLAPRS